ncbi:MAG: hypothetical protein OXI45_13820 [Acidobacteriota bacterium]|nr:hypothetical protein [Acidobacteriota bacterium]
MLLFAGFAVFLVLRLQEGFERRAAEWFGSADEMPVEPEEVVSTAVEFTRFDEQGRLVLEGRAEQALGRSDGQQRFLEVEVRLIEVLGDGDAVVAADELLLDPQTEAVEFIGNALLSVEGLELSGPHLHFRTAPDRLWSRDPVQFRSDDFVGIAASMQFEVAAGDVSLRGVVAAPAAEDGFSVIAERVRFDGATADTSLFGDVEITSSALTLFSRESVVARRDRERGRMRSIEAGFGTELTFVDPSDPVDDLAGEAAAKRLVLRGDRLEISLEDGRTPRRVWVPENPSLHRAPATELRGGEATFELDPDGTPERLSMTGEVRSRLPGGPRGNYLVSVDSSDLEVDFDPEGEIEGASFRGRVGARHGRASATAERALWDGVDTLVFEGSPRMVDSSLLELESGDLRLVIAEPSRVEAEDAVTARFLPARLDWLPGEFDGVALTGDSAVMETGSGEGVFTGGVRVLFGRNRLLSDRVSVDAEARTLEATGAVVTSLELEIPPPGAGEAERQDRDADLPAAEAGPATVRTPVAGGSAPTAGEPSGASPFVFTARAERFRYEATGAQLFYGGTPQVERVEPSGEVSRLVAGRIEADLTAEGSLGALRGVQGARFERGSNLVRGSRIRYEPGADLLLAWGSPAVVSVDGRTSEGGLLELGLGDDRTEIHPTRARRALTRAPIARRDGPSRR